MDFRPLRFPARDLDIESRAGGEYVVRSRVPMRAPRTSIPQALRDKALEHPERTWLAEREGPQGPWKRLSYADAVQRIDAITQALLDEGLRPGDRILVLSGNSTEHALLHLASMQCSVAIVPLTPAYSLLSRDFARLREMASVIEPARIFVQDADDFALALAALGVADEHVIAVHHARPAMKSFASLTSAAPGPAVAAARAAITPDTVAKYLFTSGSTGTPKAVITTQRMLCTAQAMLCQAMPREPDAPAAEVLEWLPWSHVMGGTSLFTWIIEDGGTMYLDEGRPVPGAFEATLRNLAEIAPTRYSNVPMGYAMLADALERDASLAQRFFSRVEGFVYAGARLPDEVYQRMQALALRHTGLRIPFMSGYGSTETAPTATWVYWPVDRVGLIGLPHPGVEMKLLPIDDDRYEIRIRSQALTPGYFRQPELSAQARDEEGFWRMGDAARFVAPGNFHEGFLFAGRIAEEFKLQSGVFVRTGSLRVSLIDAASPWISEVVVAGADESFVAVLAWVNEQACRDLCGADEATDLSALIAHPAVRDRIVQAWRVHNRTHPSSSTRVARALLLAQPPSMDEGEVTDKGYVNQRRVLARRQAEVQRLFATAPDSEVLVLSD